MQEKTKNYIWLFFKVISILLLIYLIYIDISIILYSNELENLSSMDKSELLKFKEELGIFSFGFLAVGSALYFSSFLGEIILFFMPFIIVIYNVLLIIFGFFTYYIFKKNITMIIILGILLLIPFLLIFIPQII